MESNYHTHTYRCGHAIGNEEQMVKAAIDANIKLLGFSEHVPLPTFRKHLLFAFPYCLKSTYTFLSWGKSILCSGSRFRMPYKQKKAHLDEIAKLQIKYKDQILLYKGFECDYLEDYLSYYKELIKSKQIDFLLLGNHFYKKAIAANYYGKSGLSIEMLYHYQDTTIKALETGLFTYIAHPDLFMQGYLKWDDHTEKISYAICKKAKELSVPLELNAGGIRTEKRIINNKESFCYPYDKFWDIVSEIGNDVVLGLDVHSPTNFDTQMMLYLNMYAKNKNLKVIPCLNMV